MYLTNFLNTHPNWYNKLQQKPYCLEIKQEDNFYLFKYNMIESDFTNPIVREARGSIFTKDENGWRCVCRSLDKFGNWGESYADTNRIDWNKSVSVQEKIDGSIIRLWCEKGLWHVSTNGTIDAFKAECGDSTFGDVFKFIVQKYVTWGYFLSVLNPSYTYWFELVSPFNQVVVHYNEAAIYYLGAREMTSMKEDIGYIKHTMNFFFSSWLKFPRHYHYECLDDVLKACHKMGEDEEGYVICAYQQMENDSFLRIKCKGDEYLKRHKLRGNGPLTSSKIISLWQTDCLDDFLAYFPENANLVNDVINKLRALYEKADIAYEVVDKKGGRKNFALCAQSYIKPIQSYLFARLDNKVDCAQTYFKQMKAKNLAELINVKEIGVK